MCFYRLDIKKPKMNSAFFITSSFGYKNFVQVVDY